MTLAVMKVTPLTPPPAGAESVEVSRWMQRDWPHPSRRRERIAVTLTEPPALNSGQNFQKRGEVAGSASVRRLHLGDLAKMAQASGAPLIDDGIFDKCAPFFDTLT